MHVRRAFVQTNSAPSGQDGFGLDASVAVTPTMPTLVAIDVPAGVPGRPAVALLSRGAHVQGRWWNEALGKPPSMFHAEFETQPGQTLALPIPIYPDGKSPDTIVLQAIGWNTHVDIAWGYVQQSIDLGIVDVPTLGANA